MLTIKIKVKYLLSIILLILMLLFILPYGYLFYADKLSENKPEAAASMYKKYIDAPGFVPNKDRAMFSLALKTFYSKGGSYYEKLNTDGSSMNASYISEDMINSTISLYKNILENYKNSSIYEKSYSNLLFIYTYEANTKAGQELIHKGETSERKSIRLIAAKYKLYYELTERKYSEVLRLGREYVKEFGENHILYRLMAEASLLTKNLDNAIDYYNKAAASEQDKYDDTLYSMFEDGGYIEKASAIKDLKMSGSKKTLVKGKVTVLGKGVPFARIYLKKLSDNGIYSGEEKGASYGLTDLNGNYSINGAPTGDYNLLLVIPGILINSTVLRESPEANFTLDKDSRVVYDFNFVKPIKLKNGGIIKPDNGYVKLSWESVHNAAYYTVHAVLFNNPTKPDGNSIWTPISDQINANSCRLDLDNLNIKPVGASISGEGSVNPQAYLGDFYAGSSVPIYVNAYDKDGLLLTSTMPKSILYDNLPVVSISSSGQTKGEKLILEGKIEEARKFLEEELKIRPGNIRFMNILSNIYANGTKVSYKSEKEALGQNLPRAIELNNKLFGITKNPEYIRKNSYIYQYELKDYRGLLKNYANIPTSKLVSEDYDTIGEAYLLTGKFEEAKKRFDKMYETMGLAPLSNFDPILLDLYNSDISAAETALERTSFKLYRVSETQLNRDIKGLKLSSSSSNEYEAFKKILHKVLMRNLNSTNVAEIKNISGQIKDPYITDLIKLIRYYYIIN